MSPQCDVDPSAPVCVRTFQLASGGALKTVVCGKPEDYRAHHVDDTKRPPGPPQPPGIHNHSFATEPFAPTAPSAPPLTDAELSDAELAVREALNGITPLPWEARTPDIPDVPAHVVCVSQREGGERRTAFIAAFQSATEPNAANASAIATVMNAAPQLLALIDAQRSELDTLRAVCGPVCETCGMFAVQHFQNNGDCALSPKSPWPDWCPVTPEYVAWLATRGGAK